MTRKHSDLFLATDHAIVLEGLVDDAEQPVTTATVELTELKDAAGEDVLGITLPVAMTHTDAGTYRGSIPAALEITAGVIYKAKVRAAANGLTSTFFETLVAREQVA